MDGFYTTLLHLIRFIGLAIRPKELAAQWGEPAPHRVRCPDHYRFVWPLRELEAPFGTRVVTRNTQRRKSAIVIVVRFRDVPPSTVETFGVYLDLIRLVTPTEE
jgi:hypothetical protein